MKLKLSSLALATALAVGSTGALAAGGPIDLSSGSAFFGSTPTAGGFSDLFTFTLTTASTLTASITSPVSGTQDVDISFAAVTGPGGAFSFTSVLADPFETLTLSTPLLSAGAYSLTVVGTNTPSIGSYGGSIAVTPVPEPETYALMLAGLGVMGFVAARRKS